MTNRNYYSFFESEDPGINSGNRASDKDSLLLNCAGCFSTAFPFTTDNRKGRDDYYFMFVTEGSLTFAERISVNAGDLLIIPPHTPYRYVHERGETVSYLWAHFTGRDTEKILLELSLSFFPTVHKSLDQTRVLRRFEGILNAYAGAAPFCEMELSALLLRLLITAARAANYKTPTTLRTSLAYIAEHYADDISVGALARLESLSPSRYHALFKAQMGLSPVQYILRLRMASAKDLLTATDLSVKQIGLLCGYRDPHFFSKVFKKEAGVSPTDFRTGKS